MESRRKFTSLKRTSDFENLKKNSHRFRCNPWLLLSVATNKAEADRIGCTISRKVGKAVVRNRLKRWVREYFRFHGNVLAIGLDVNVVLIPNKNSREFFKTLPHGKLNESLEINWKSARTRFQRGSTSNAQLL